jgi:hypothetical protein
MIRIVLISPLLFKETNGSLREAIIIASSQSETESSICSSWTPLDGKIVCLHDASNHDLNILDALSKERNLSFRKKSDFCSSVTGTIFEHPYEITAHLIVDQHFNFLVLFNCAIECEDSAASGLLSTLLENRIPITALGQQEFSSEVVQRALNVVTDELKKPFDKKYKLEGSYEFTVDSAYPIVFMGSQEAHDFSKYLKNEENIEQRSVSSLIASDYKNGYLHLGWNYSFSKNLPENINNSVFCMMVRLQLYYYQIVFFKKFFQKKISLLTGNNKIGNADVENYEHLQMAYNRMHLDYKTYKSGLYPKLYCEFEEVERLWHLDKDEELIKEIFTLQKDFIDKKYKTKIERFAARQSFALNLLAVLNVFGIFGLWFNYNEMKEKYSHDFDASVAVTICLFVLILPLILWPLITGAIEAFQKRNNV